MAFEPTLDAQQLNVFRTHLCDRLTQSECNFGSRCQYSHHTHWPRRSPFFAKTHPPSLRYLPVFCPNIRVRHGVAIQNLCKRADSCPFAHSVEEFLYHPAIYKTQMCCDFEMDGFCPRYYCHYAHYASELRFPRIHEWRRPQLSIREWLNILSDITSHSLQSVLAISSQGIQIDPYLAPETSNGVPPMSCFYDAFSLIPTAYSSLPTSKSLLAGTSCPPPTGNMVPSTSLSRSFLCPASLASDNQTREVSFTPAKILPTVPSDTETSGAQMPRQCNAFSVAWVLNNNSKKSNSAA